MLNYYKNIFKFLICNKLDNSSGVYTKLEKALESEGYISSQEFSEVEETYKNEKESIISALLKLKDEGKLRYESSISRKIEEMISKFYEIRRQTQVSLEDFRRRVEVESLKNLLKNRKILKIGCSGEEVKSLQNILIKRKFLESGQSDGAFGPKTKRALEELQKELRSKGFYNYRIDGVFGPKTKKALLTLISGESFSGIAERQIRIQKKERQLKEKLGAYQLSLEDALKLFGQSKDIQEYIAKLRDNPNTYSLKDIIESTITDENRKARIFAEAAKKKALLKDSEKLKRLETALNSLLGSDIDTDIVNMGAVDKAKDFILKVWPWLFGIYVADIPMPFTAKLVPGLDLNQSLALSEWIEYGMDKDFEYSGTNKLYGRDIIEKAWDLRGALSTYMGEETDKKTLSGEVGNITEKEKKVLKSFVENIILPQLQYAHDDSFTVLKGDLFNFFDWISGQQAESQRLINELRKAIKAGNFQKVKDLLDRILSGLKKEDEVSSREVVSSIDKKVNNFKLMKENHEILLQMSRMLGLGEGRLNILFKFEDLENFINAYGLQDFKICLGKVYENIKEGKNDLFSGLSDQNKKMIKELFSVVGTDKLGEFKLRYLKKKNNVEYVNRGLHKYGKDLRNVSNSEEKYKLLSYYGVEREYNTIDTLFKGLVQIQGLDNIGYKEFDEALKKLEKITIGPDGDLKSVVINTSRQGLDNSYITSFEKGLDQNDDHINYTFIEKDFIYYEGGKKIKEKIKYHIYLRAECSNLLIVPETIELEKVIEQAPYINVDWYEQTPRKVPIIISYPVFGSSLLPSNVVGSMPGSGNPITTVISGGPRV